MHTCEIQENGHKKIAVDIFHKSTHTQLSLNLGRVTPPPSVQHHLPIAVHWLHPLAHYAKLERFVTKVVQLCSSPSLQLQYFDLTDGRRVQFKHHLNAHPVYDISQDKSRPEAIVSSSDADADEPRLSRGGVWVSSYDRDVATRGKEGDMGIAVSLLYV